jgi:hypothetical protein
MRPALTRVDPPVAARVTACRTQESLLGQAIPATKRRGGDSNPRWTETPIPVFETGANGANSPSYKGLRR